MNINTDFSYYKKNNNLLYDIPVYISFPEIIYDNSIYNDGNLSKKYNKINFDEKFLRNLSMYDNNNFREDFKAVFHSVSEHLVSYFHIDEASLTEAS